MATTEPIRSKEQLKALADYFLEQGKLRNYVMIVMGACTALRISDLLRLRWREVYNAEHETISKRKPARRPFYERTKSGRHLKRRL